MNSTWNEFFNMVEDFIARKLFHIIHIVQLKMNQMYFGNEKLCKFNIQEKSWQRNLVVKRNLAKWQASKKSNIKRY